MEAHIALKLDLTVWTSLASSCLCPLSWDHRHEPPCCYSVLSLPLAVPSVPGCGKGVSAKAELWPFLAYSLAGVLNLRNHFSLTLLFFL